MAARDAAGGGVLVTDFPVRDADLATARDTPLAVAFAELFAVDAADLADRVELEDADFLADCVSTGLAGAGFSAFVFGTFVTFDARVVAAALAALVGLRLATERDCLARGGIVLPF